MKASVMFIIVSMLATHTILIKETVANADLYKQNKHTKGEQVLSFQFMDKKFSQWKCIEPSFEFEYLG